MGLNKTLLAQLLAGAGAAPLPATIFKSFTEMAGSYVGYYSIPSGGRGNMLVGNLALRIKGSSASLFSFSGDTTPFRVLVDSDTFSTRAIPTLASGKIPLFSGLSDTWHDVIVWRDNSVSGQGFAITGNLVEAYGSGADAQPMGVAYYLTDPTFPGVSTVQVATQADNPSGMLTPALATGWTTTAIGSIHMRARFDKLYIFANKAVTHVMVSVNGALATACAVSAWDDSTQGIDGWRLVTLTASPSSYAELIISGGGAESGVITAVQMTGIMAYGSTASIIAPTSTKRHVAMLGASQVEGIVSGAGGYRNDIQMAQNRLSIYATNNGLAGGTIANLTTAIPTIAGKFQAKDICLLSVGINSADDGSFQSSYQALITAVLVAGWTKVICRGLVTTTAQTSKNAKIAAAVAAIANPNVVYADVSTWVATTNGVGGTIAMPDGAHPNAAGFATMADFMVRDHASLFT